MSRYSSKRRERVLGSPTSACSSANEPDARPQIRADLEVFAPPAMELLHPALPDRVHAREGLLRDSDRIVADVLDQFIRRCPRRRIGFTHYYMQPHSEPERAAKLS